jgi:predicted RNase H-like HicB family nuclease
MSAESVVTRHAACVTLAVNGMATEYTVDLIHSEEGFAVGCPSLPGCWSQGDTEQEALTNIAGAIKDYLEVAAELRVREYELTKVA